MTQTFKNLYKMVKTILLTPFDHDDSPAWMEIWAEVSILKINTVELIGNAASREQASLIITSATISCTMLADEVYNFLKTDRNNWQIKECRKLEKQLVDFLHFFRKHFSQFFDDTQHIPEYCRDSMQKKIRKDCTDLREQLTRNCRDGKLVSLILSTLLSRLSPAARVTWREYAWIARCLVQLHKLTMPANAKHSKARLVNWLIVNGFNKPAFIQHVILILKKQAIRCDSLKEQLHFWGNVSRHFELLDKCAAPPVYPRLQQFLVMINQHIQLEKNALKRCLADAQTQSPQCRCTTNLSVAQLALLLKLLWDAGIIQYGNQRELIKSVATIFKTTKAVEISTESLRTKYYSPDRAAINIIREYLINMINTLK